MIMKRSILLITLLIGTALFVHSEFKTVPKTRISNSNIWWEVTADSTFHVTGTGEIPAREEFMCLPEGIKRIVIGEGITSIESYAFRVANTHPDLPKQLYLPSTLVNIGDYAFSQNRIEAIILPESVKTIGQFAFQSSWAKIVKLPKKIKKIGCEAFEYNKIKYLEIFGNPDIHISGEDLKRLKHLVIHDNPNCTTNLINAKYPDLCLWITSKFTDNKVISGSNVGQVSYLSLGEQLTKNVPSFEEYVEQTAGIKTPNASAEKAKIEQDIANWQVKGEFENTAMWKERVNEATRRARVDSLLASYNNHVDLKKGTYNEILPKIREEYTYMLFKKTNEFYNNLIDWKSDPYYKATLTLKPYDADNEAFTINSSEIGDIRLQVPIEKASAFKDNWKSVNIEYWFVPKDEADVALRKITFTLGDEKYEYKFTSTPRFPIEDIDYNKYITPVVFKNLTIDDLTLPAIPQ